MKGAKQSWMDVDTFIRRANETNLVEVNHSLPDREAGSRIARSRAEKKERQEQMATVQAGACNVGTPHLYTTTEFT